MSVMTSPDEAGASGGVPKPPPSGSLPVPAEPMPAENRRLPKADSRPAPVFALLRARWPWLVIAALIGTVIGLLLGAAQNYQSTAVIRLLGVNDSQRVKQVGQTVEFMATSPAVSSPPSQFTIWRASATVRLFTSGAVGDRCDLRGGTRAFHY